MARQLPRGARSSGRLQSFGIIFSFSRPLTGRSWTATLFFLYDRTLICSPPFTHLIILLLLLANTNRPKSVEIVLVGIYSFIVLLYYSREAWLYF